MLNSAILIGRLVRDPEIYGNDKIIAKLTLAVDKGFGDDKYTNYIPVTAFGKTAEFCEKYLGKGSLVSVNGEIRTGTYEKKDGTKMKTFEVVANELRSLEKRSGSTQTSMNTMSGFEEVNEDCPF